MFCFAYRCLPAPLGDLQDLEDPSRVMARPGFTVVPGDQLGGFCWWPVTERTRGSLGGRHLKAVGGTGGSWQSGRGAGEGEEAQETPAGSRARADCGPHVFGGLGRGEKGGGLYCA